MHMVNKQNKYVITTYIVYLLSLQYQLVCEVPIRSIYLVENSIYRMRKNITYACMHMYVHSTFEDFEFQDDPLAKTRYFISN